MQHAGESRSCVQSRLPTMLTSLRDIPQVNGRPTSTGRWLLLRHSHFLLRASHTIAWIDNPSFDPSHPALHPTHPEFSACSGKQFRETVSVVWDWKSSTERWRWAMWLVCGGEMYARPTASGHATAEELEVEVEGSIDDVDWDMRTDDGIAVGESISAADREMKEISLA